MAIFLHSISIAEYDISSKTKYSNELFIFTDRLSIMDLRHLQTFKTIAEDGQ